MIKAPATVKLVCVYADKRGVSHLVDVELPGLPQTFATTVMGFVVGKELSVSDWHVSTMVGLSIVLSGEWEIEAGNGDRRLLGVGSVLLMLDVEGQGHRARSTSDAGCTVLGIGADEASRTSFSRLVEHLV